MVSNLKLHVSHLGVSNIDIIFYFLHCWWIGVASLAVVADSSLFHPAGSSLLHPDGSSLLHPAGSILNMSWTLVTTGLLFSFC